jgi:hypothetical protein
MVGPKDNRLAVRKSSSSGILLSSSEQIMLGLLVVLTADVSGDARPGGYCPLLPAAERVANHCDIFQALEYITQSPISSSQINK